MADAPLSLDIEYFPDPTKGIPISGGDVYIGQPDTDPEVLGNRVSVVVIQEDGTRVTIDPAAQPLQTGAGGVILYNGSAVVVLVDGIASVKVLDSFGAQKYYVPFANESSGVAFTIDSLVINGSFESETQFSGLPDSWTVTEFTNGTVELDETPSNVTQGEQSLKFTSLGLGGGTATSNKFTVEKNQFIAAAWAMKSSVVDVRNIVKINWYDSTDSLISTSTIYDDATANPLTFERYVYPIISPSTASTAEFVIIGCDESDATSGSTWFDNVVVTQDEKPAVETHVDYESDFFTVADWQASIGGGPSANNGLLSPKSGVLSLSSTAVGQDSATSFIGVQISKGDIYCRTLITTPSAVSDVTDDYVLYIGFSQAGLTGNGTWFQYNHASSAGNFECVTDSGAGTTTTDSGIALAATTDYILEIRINSDGTSVDFYIDGSLVAQNTTDIYILGNIQPFYYLDRLAGTNSRFLNADYIVVRQSVIGGR